MSFSTTLPLTTVFTPPADCASRWTFEPEQWNSIPGGILLKNAGYTSQDTSCYPSGFNNWGRAPSFIQVFSPGACPSGYQTVSNGYDNGEATTAVCCPTSFSYTATLSSVNAGNKSANYYGCTSSYPAASAPLTVFAQSDGVSSVLYGTSTKVTTISTEILMWAQPLTIAFQQKDLALFTTSTSAPSASSTASSTSSIASPTSSSSQPSSSSTAASSTSSSSSSTVSGGAIAGIAIGAAAVLGIFIGLAILFRRRKKAPQPTDIGPQMGQAPPDHTSWQPNGYPSYEIVTVRPSKTAQELDVQPKQHGQNAFAELGTNVDRRYELSTDNR